MKVLVIDHYYPRFLRQFESSHPDNKEISYAGHLNLILAEQFGTADFYSRVLNGLGSQTQDVIVNYDALQEKWALENGIPSDSFPWDLVQTAWQRMSYLAARKASPRQLKILSAQIQSFKPDVLYIHNLSFLPSSFLHQMKRFVRLIVGQIAAPIPPVHNFRSFDLIVTSLPHFVSHFRQRGIHSEYLPLCFEPRVLSRRQPLRKYPLTFIGSFFGMHTQSQSAFAEIAHEYPLKVWGSPAAALRGTALASCYQGEAWGRDMYAILQRSAITLNRHSVVSAHYANNMRLFEATGCGALLITDAKDNLAEFFIPGREILVYHNAGELRELISYYSQHSRERVKIAKAGQQRTLRDHTYAVRMKQLINILENYL